VKVAARQLPLATLIGNLRNSSAFAHKRDIAAVLDMLRDTSARRLAGIGAECVDNGDDCAALADGQGGYLLFAMEGMVDSFVRSMPWFAGYSAVMVNVSDVYAMGGRPLAVIDAIWSQDALSATPVLSGMREAASRYGVPLVGGHTNHRAAAAGLAVAILGRASHLLAASAARPKDVLVMAVDLRGGYMEPNPFWNASTEAPAARLRQDLEILPLLAEHGLCRAAKDISMAGPLGSTLMLLEAAGCGAAIDLDALPIPDGVSIERWLLTFPSYGFVLAVAPDQVSQVLARFSERDLSAAAIGEVTRGSRVVIRRGDKADAESCVLWDFDDEPFTGARPGRAAVAERALCQ
jgi:AIR synthase-related protein